MENEIKPNGRKILNAAGLLLIPAGVILYGALFFQYVHNSPFAVVPVLDAQYYYRLAVNAAFLGKGWPPVFFSAPLYPVVLTIAVFITGGGLESLYLLGLLTGLASVFLVYRTAGKVFSPLHGVVAGWLCLLYFPLAFSGLKLLPETLGIFLLALFLYFSANLNFRSSFPRFCLLGLAGGLLVLARTQAAPLALVCILAIPWAAGPFENKRRAAVMCLAAAACAALPIMAWGCVNLYRSGEFFFFPPNGGLTFYQGNNPRANGTYTSVPGLTDDINDQLKEMTALVSRETGRDVTTGEADGHFWKLGFSFIREHPSDWLRLELKKAKLAVGVREPGLIYDQYLESGLHLPVSRFFPVNWAMLAALALIGLSDILVFRREMIRRLFPVLVSGLFLGALLLAFYVAGRYRVLLLCPVAIFASHGVASIIGWAKERLFGPLAPAGLLIAAVVWRSLVFTPDISPGAMNNLAYALIVKGEYRQAEKICRMVLTKNPADASAVRNLAVTLAARGK